MKQFGKILNFELKGYWKNKLFVGVTVFLVAAIAIVMYFPNLSALFSGESEPAAEAQQPVMLIQAQDERLARMVCQRFTEVFPEYQVQTLEDAGEDARDMIIGGLADCAFVLDSDLSYTYYVNNLSMYDTNSAVAKAQLQEVYRYTALLQAGVSAEQATQIMTTQVEGTEIALGKDQFQNFFYTYVMILALYLVILLYGQMVSTNVAAEKSSRAMEVLITSANPVSMMFGKVLASCLAGLTQLVAVFGSALLFYHLNQSAWDGNPIIESLFNIPTDLFVYMLVFFVLGFLLYAFMYGAIGSTASKLEDINTAVLPVTFLFVIAFVIIVTSMSGGDTDSMLMKVCSYIPFTSPMAMFTRICMSTVSWVEIAISMAILAGTTVVIGYLAAKIYRVGVLLYGTKPKISSVLKALRQS